MSDVTGQIGNESIELDNAATESTLRLLLQAMLATSKEQKENIKQFAKKAGLDPDIVEKTDQNINELGDTANQTSTLLGKLNATSNVLASSFSHTVDYLQQFTSGTGKISGMFEPMERFGGILGLVGLGLEQFFGYQEKNLAIYRQITNSGVSFNGSLTDMRMAAANTYMTLEQFSNLIKNNSETLSRLGGSANDGTVAFTKMSNNLIKSPLGDHLLGLGYTTEQLNQGLLNYIQVSGGRNKEEMKNTKDITDSSAEYLTIKWVS